LERRGLIGHILVDLGYIKLKQVNEARRKQMAYPVLKLGEVLIGMKALTPEQLDQGLKLQERVRRLEKKEVEEPGMTG
jgi:hypothetical protein